MRNKIITIGIIVFILFGLTLTGCSRQAEKDNTPAKTSPPAVETETPKDPPAPAVKPEQPSGEGSTTTTAPAATAPATKSYSWYFTRNSQHQTPFVNQDISNLLSAHGAFYVLPNNNSRIYLTFDAGYEQGYTARILDTLKANGVHAAFFITGQYLRTQPDLAKRMKAEGNLVCNHTVNHPDCAKISSDSLKKEIKSLEEQYLQVTGQEMDRYLRPPMGNYSESSLKTTQELGYKTVFWSMAFNDWDPSNQPGADYSYNHVINNIHPGAVILLHAVSQSDTEALDRIIKDLQSQGYVFATFNQ
jgi:peptidoglycan-N-acetylmuramic acid deacetylase